MRVDVYHLDRPTGNDQGNAHQRNQKPPETAYTIFGFHGCHDLLNIAHTARLLYREDSQWPGTPLTYLAAEHSQDLQKV